MFRAVGDSLSLEQAPNLWEAPEREQDFQRGREPRVRDENAHSRAAGQPIEWGEAVLKPQRGWGQKPGFCQRAELAMPEQSGDGVPSGRFRWSDWLSLT